MRKKKQFKNFLNNFEVPCNSCLPYYGSFLRFLEKCRHHIEDSNSMLNYLTFLEEEFAMYSKDVSHGVFTGSFQEFLDEMYPVED